jgi:Flp pilus assembly protein TadD
MHKDQTALEEAGAEARLALELDPNLPAAQVALARVLLNSGHTDASIARMEEALAGHPSPAQAQTELAYAYERAQDFEGAERCLRAATALASHDWFNWNWLGTFLARTGRYDEARRAFQKASVIAPADVYLPRENLATIDLSSGRFRQAIEAFQKLPQEMVQVRPRLASNIGTAYFFSDQPDRLERALEHYRLAVDLRPNHAEYHRNLGDAYRGLGRADDARDEFRRALSLKEADLERDPENPRFKLEQAEYAAKAQQCSQALPLAEELNVKLPASGRTAHQLAYVFALCDRPDSALAALERAIDLGESPATIRREAEFESLRGNPVYEELLGG